jgi:hypothetical protein
MLCGGGGGAPPSSNVLEQQALDGDERYLHAPAALTQRKDTPSHID